jgi:elongation factor G
MKIYEQDKIRNIVLVSHYGAGKTSISEAMLFTSGTIKRLGSSDEGTTTSDYDQSEIEHHMSINLSLLPQEWQGTKLNIMDTPGYADFAGEVKSAIRVSTGAIVVIDAVAGVEVGTEKVWEYVKQANLPKLIVINKIDRENVDFFRSLESVQSKFGLECLPVQLPLGFGSAFEGIIDLITMKAYQGVKADEIEIPSAMLEQAKLYREKLVESAVEVDDALVTRYLEGEEISNDEIAEAIKHAIIKGKLVPIFTCSALQNIGINLLLDGICYYLPSAKEIDVITVLENGLKSDKEIKTETESSLVGFVFKTTADQFTGKISYLKIYSGTLTSNSQVWNPNKNITERIGQLFTLLGKTQSPVEKLTTGDIGALAKLSSTVTGDTLCSQEHPLLLEKINFPEVNFSLAIHSENKDDLDKIGTILPKLCEEDPSLKVHRDTATKETIISGIGDNHLEMVKERMQRKFGVSVKLQTPKIAYKETISVATKAEYKHKKQSGGHGQYGHVLLELEPLPRGSGFTFVNKIVGGTVPKNYIPAIEKGVNEAKTEGILAGYPLDDIRVTLYDGSFHAVDSSEIAFKIAAAQALKQGLNSGQSILLEPIMNISIIVPSINTGDIMGDLNTKRGRVLGMEPNGENSIIQAQAPYSELIRYAIDLKSITQGRGSFSLEFSNYEIVPPHISQKVIEEKAAEKK